MVFCFKLIHIIIDGRLNRGLIFIRLDNQYGETCVIFHYYPLNFIQCSCVAVSWEKACAQQWDVHRHTCCCCITSGTSSHLIVALQVLKVGSYTFLGLWRGWTTPLLLQFQSISECYAAVIITCRSSYCITEVPNLCVIGIALTFPE